MEKTEWGSEIVIFLGILLDGRNYLLAIPEEKRQVAIELLTELSRKTKTTVHNLQKLCRYLNFISRAIFPGRPFIHRMYAKYSGIVKIDYKVNKTCVVNYKFKKHHHVWLDKEFCMDCNIWLEFLSCDFLASVNHLMVDILGYLQTSEDVSFYSDASGKIGFGCILKESWIRGDWEPSFIANEKPSIEFLELFALTARVLTWVNRPQMCNNRISIYCDNISVVHMINNMMSGCKRCMQLIRILTLNGLRYNRRLFTRHIDTKSNFLADALSRGQMMRFRKLGQRMEFFPSEVCNEIWPIDKVWQWWR